MNADWFAGRLRELREQAGLTQQQLGQKAGLSQAGIADLEQQRQHARASVVQEQQHLVVNHGDIPGFMSAMTMP